MASIKKGDLVVVIAGARQSRGGDRGKTGRVLEVLTDRNRVIVEGVNLVTKHIKVGQTNRGTRTGGIETHEAPIHVSNVALVDPESKKPTRVRSEVTTSEKNGVTTTTKVRVSTKSGKEIKSND
ncbi:50S ribosomal protein L24 [Agrococcus terreus]|uniref:Large ribosomal subunit protein uL24 n=1 Tax=Agrococcus terreus TaxID=574649 RepID=A0ABQ2KBX4_9MICO|nr:50S ribosomal protein L24 [Agrococcus terreus]GGN78887.1 50S ribosomal protein L24 [Agrococcus terreus]